MKSELKWGATLLALVLWMGVVLGANASEVDASKWGVYQRLAGTTRQPEDKGGYWMRWRWSQEGTELLEEYINPNKDKDTAAYTNTIALGERTGELLLTSSVLGNKQWAGTLQSDGSVVFVGKGLLKWTYHVVLTPDGVLEVRRAKVRDGALVSDAAATPWTRYPPTKTDSPEEAAYSVTSPAPAPPASTGSSTPVETATPVVPVSSESPADRARRLFGPMAALAGQSFIYHYVTASVDLAEDGGVFILHCHWGTMRLREGPDGSLQFLELPERTSRAIAHLESDGALVMELTYPGSFRVRGSTVRHTFTAEPDRPGFTDVWDEKTGRIPLTSRYSYFDTQEYYADTEANRSEQKVLAADELARDERVRAEREAERDAENAAMFNAVMGGLQQGADEARYAQAQDDARQEEMQAQLRHIEEQQAQLREARDAQEREAGQPVTYASAATTGPSSSPTPQATNRSLSGSGTGSWEHASGPSTLRSESQTGGEASTRNDPSTCLTPPEASPHRCGDKTGTKAVVANQCNYPVDVRMCFMTDRGWNCQANYGLNPGRTWEPGWCNAINDQVFHSVRYSDSKDTLQNP